MDSTFMNGFYSVQTPVKLGLCTEPTQNRKHTHNESSEQLVHILGGSKDTHLEEGNRVVTAPRKLLREDVLLKGTSAVDVEGVNKLPFLAFFSGIRPMILINA